MIVFVLFNLRLPLQCDLLVCYCCDLFQRILGKKIPLDIKNALHLIGKVDKLECCRPRGEAYYAEIIWSFSSNNSECHT
jgi:hypothetical protein